MKLERVNKTYPQEILPQIVKRIFAVCKNDPSFSSKDELQIMEHKISSLQQKIKRQEKLLEQSITIENDFKKRIRILDEQNEQKQTELLENLGSNL